MISTWTAFLPLPIPRPPDVFDPDKPYNDLPLLPPKAKLESRVMLRKAIAATKAVADLKSLGF